MHSFLLCCLLPAKEREKNSATLTSTIPMIDLKNNKVGHHTYIKIILCLLCLMAIGCVVIKLILVLKTILAFMDGPAGQAVWVATHRAHKDVYIVLKHTPPGAVSRFAMVTIGRLTLGSFHTSWQVMFINLSTHQSFNFSLLQMTTARILIIPERAFHHGFFTITNSICKTISEKGKWPNQHNAG